MRVFYIGVALCVAVPSSFTLYAGTEPDLEVSSVSFPRNVRTRESYIDVDLDWKGTLANRVVAARAMAVRAVDSNGAILEQEQKQEFYRAKVGSFTGDGARLSSRQKLHFTFAAGPLAAESLRSVEGIVEAIVPDLDPAATWEILNVRTRLGEAVVSDRPGDIGISITVFDAGTQRSNRTGADVVHLGVKLVDRGNRIVRMEFQLSDGKSLPYDHNGYSHSEDTVAGVKEHLFRFDEGIPADVKFVCWLITEKSLVKYPLKLADVSLPRWAERRAMDEKRRVTP